MNNKQNDAFESLINRIRDGEFDDDAPKAPAQPPRSAGQPSAPAGAARGAAAPSQGQRQPVSRPRSGEGTASSARPAASSPARGPQGSRPQAVREERSAARPAGGSAPARRQEEAPQRERPSRSRRPSGDFVVRIENNEFESLPDRGSSGSGGGRRGGGEPPVRRGGSGRENGQPKPRRRHSRAERWFQALIISGCMVAVSVFLAIFAIGSASDLFGLNQQDELVDLTITEGMSFDDVVDELVKLDVIEQPFTFDIYTGLKHKDVPEELEAGDYQFNKNMSYDEILLLLRQGLEDETVQISFPEGFTIQAIADRLEENRVCSAEDFLEAAKNVTAEDYPFLEGIPAEGASERYYPLEGFIFPDTYEFYVGESPENALARFLNNFEKKMSDETLTARMEEKGMTLYETITLASMIQRESSNTKNMKPVSSVFHNRLANPQAFPLLQSDVTTFYVRDTIMPNFPDRANEPLDENNEYMRAYSTYYCTGLPAGPICNPGMAAIEAALYPDDTNYYFFVTDDEGNYYYAATADEHAQNVAVAMPSGDAHGTGVGAVQSGN